MRGPARQTALVLSVAIAAGGACAPRRPALPGGTASPFPGAAQAYVAAVQECRGAKAMRATLGLSGRAGSQTLRGNLDGGFEAPDRVRLEMRAPIGRPIFILAAADAGATLYLPRDNRVLRDAPAADIVEALVGVPIGGAELRALLSGCGFGVAEPEAGRAYSGGWLAVDTAGAATFLREIDGRWRVVAASRPPLSVHYSTFTGARPTALRLQASGPSVADLTVRLSDVQINVPLGPDVFAIDVPAAADPLTLEELRRAGPLGAS